MLSAVGPVLNTVSRTKTSEITEMIRVNFTAVTCLVVSKAVGSCIASSEEVTPEEQIRRELAIIPSITTNLNDVRDNVTLSGTKETYIVTPLVTVIIISVDDIAVIPEAIPATLLNLVLVEFNQELHVVFNRLSFCGVPWRARHVPVAANGLSVTDVGWLRNKDRGVVGVVCQGREVVS